MFIHESFKFLKNLEENNSKEWFVSNKSDYQTHITLPLKELILDLEIFINMIDILLETKPVTNKAIPTIYRDTRYSRNKLPLKTYIGFNFRKQKPNWKQFPAFILRVNSRGYYFGMAVMENNSDHFYNFRKNIDEEENIFKKIIKDIESDKNFELYGENYKKFAYKGASENLKKWYCKKNIFIKCTRGKNHYKSKKDLILDIQESFEKLVPLYQYFNKIFSYEE